MASRKTLRDLIADFMETLKAATIPCKDGRRIPDELGASLLSDKADTLHQALAQSVVALLRRYGRKALEVSGITCEEADSPDGPWRPVPLEAVQAITAKIGGDGIPVALYTAIHRATQSTAFPNERWNQPQANGAGRRHRRYDANDVISNETIEILRSVEHLLALVDDDQLPNIASPSAEGIEYGPIVQMELAATSEQPDIPPYSDDPKEWCNNKEAARREGRMKVATLARYRHYPLAQWIAEDRLSGIDKDGRMWRKQGTIHSHARYYIPSLMSSRS